MKIVICFLAVLVVGNNYVSAVYPNYYSGPYMGKQYPLPMKSFNFMPFKSGFSHPPPYTSYGLGGKMMPSKAMTKAPRIIYLSKAKGAPQALKPMPMPMPMPQPMPLKPAMMKAGQLIGTTGKVSGMVGNVAGTIPPDPLLAQNTLTQMQSMINQIQNIVQQLATRNMPLQTAPIVPPTPLTLSPLTSLLSSLPRPTSPLAGLLPPGLTSALAPTTGLQNAAANPLLALLQQQQQQAAQQQALEQQVELIEAIAGSQQTPLGGSPLQNQLLQQLLQILSSQSGLGGQSQSSAIIQQLNTAIQNAILTGSLLTAQPVIGQVVSQFLPILQALQGSLTPLNAQQLTTTVIQTITALINQQIQALTQQPSQLLLNSYISQLQNIVTLLSQLQSSGVGSGQNSLLSILQSLGGGAAGAGIEGILDIVADPLLDTPGATGLGSLLGQNPGGLTGAGGQLGQQPLGGLTGAGTQPANAFATQSGTQASLQSLLGSTLGPMNTGGMTGSMAPTTATALQPGVLDILIDAIEGGAAGTPALGGAGQQTIAGQAGLAAISKAI